MHKGILTGLGGRGLYWYDQIKQRSDCDIVACVEPNEGNRKRAIDDRGVPAQTVCASFDEAVAKDDGIDFVLDVTPPAVHHKIAEQAFAHKLHILGEKPLSDDYAVASRVVAQGQAAGVKHMITQNYRFTPQPRTTRRLLAEGLIGQPGQCDVRFYMNWADIPGSHYVTQPYMLINDMMVHHFDMMRYVLGREPRSVQAITWNHPWGWHKGDAAHAIVFRYADGLVATHVSVGCAVGSVTSWNGEWRIEGPGGSIDWQGNDIRHVHRARTEKPVDELVALDDVKPGVEAMVDEFFAAIDENREPECSAADNLKSVAMVFGAIKSTKEKREVNLSEL